MLVQDPSASGAAGLRRRFSTKLPGSCMVTAAVLGSLLHAILAGQSISRIGHTVAELSDRERERERDRKRSRERLSASFEAAQSPFLFHRRGHLDERYFEFASGAENKFFLRWVLCRAGGRRMASCGRKSI
jgi:hypothetical protein